MKTISAFIILFLMISTNLNARTNPFEPTQTYETEFSRLMEIEEDYPYEFQEKEDQVEHKSKEMMPEIKQTQTSTPTPKVMMKKEMPVAPVKKIMSPKMMTPKMDEPKMQAPKMTEEKKPMKKMHVKKPASMKMERVSLDVEKQKTLENKKQKISLENAMSELSEEQIEVEVPKRMDVIVQESIDILPFVNITYSNDKMEVSSKYEVFRKFTIEKSNKIVLDYHASTFFQTKKQASDTEYFEKVIVGNHIKEKYFRVVIVLKQKPGKYKVTYTDNLVTIEFDKNMI